MEQEQSQEDDEVEDHPRRKNKRRRAEPEEDSMADETTMAAETRQLLGMEATERERTVWMELSLLDAVVSSLCHP